MATTSVNISGQAPMNDYVEIVKQFGDKVLYVYPNVLNLSKVSSTIVDLTANELVLIREGRVKFTEITNFLNNK
jgi:tRNA A37 threonylcarbamoyladenosine synthetase subunit TsaC/SUA5/YrdC